MRVLILTSLSVWTSLAMSLPPVQPATCATSSDGTTVCAPAGGEAMTDKYGKVVTGKGACAMDAMGDVKCADTPGGGAAVNRFGEVVTGKGKCLVNQFGEVKCANTPGGGAEINSMGEIKTGPGQCVRNATGFVMCSSTPNGGAALDQYGKAVCTGECVPGQ